MHVRRGVMAPGSRLTAVAGDDEELLGFLTMPNGPAASTVIARSIAMTDNKSSFLILKKAYIISLSEFLRHTVMSKHFDIPTVLVIIVTFVLFLIALFVKGMTHDILLETGVFLVSVKLILMSYKSSLTNQKIMDELREIKNMLDDKK